MTVSEEAFESIEVGDKVRLRIEGRRNYPFTGIVKAKADAGIWVDIRKKIYFYRKDMISEVQ